MTEAHPFSSFPTPSQLFLLHRQGSCYWELHAPWPSAEAESIPQMGWANAILRPVRGPGVQRSGLSLSGNRSWSEQMDSLRSQQMRITLLLINPSVRIWALVSLQKAYGEILTTDGIEKWTFAGSKQWGWKHDCVRCPYQRDPKEIVHVFLG